ncbi:MAG: hypothetical protein FJZ00_04665 [Candidatus Sericytochromatia bacterium]|uniref:Uncharacterized protein n=1 Tax=Candidatus Tanganyikabacteria bacterium TaxID=2961651 RepID=A0A937X1W6_9BACT|nr:hypothetical protein [Candidatus Tanganyikabacteria bacterium]
MAHQRGVIQFVEMPHEVVCDPLAGDALSHDAGLQLQVKLPVSRREAAPVEPVAGVGAIHQPGGRQDLFPCGVALAPDRGAPGLIERFERPVAFLGKDLEQRRAALAVAPYGVVAAQFVVDLPSDDCRMAAEPLGQCAGDATGMVQVRGAGRTVVAAAAGPADLAVGPDRQDFSGQTRGQPGGRCGGRGAKHGRKAGSRGKRDGLFEPVEVELADLGFEAGPRELPHADQLEAGFAHEGEIRRPPAARGLLRVIRRTKRDHPLSLERFGALSESRRA